MWNEIKNQEDIDAFMNEVNYFHDTCLKELKYLSGAFVGEDFGMHPINDRRILSVIIQRQVKEMPMLELEFSGLKYLRLFPVDEIYTCEILEASLFMKDGYIYWSDREIDSVEDSRDRDGTLVCAAKLRWRPIAKNFSDQLYYVNCK